MVLTLFDSLLEDFAHYCIMSISIATNAVKIMSLSLMVFTSLLIKLFLPWPLLLALALGESND